MTKSSVAKDWHLVKLGEVAVRVMGKYEASPTSPEPWVGADHLDEGDLRIRRWSMSDDPVFPPTFKFKFPIGAVLIHSRNPKKVAIAEFSAITGEKIFALSSRDDLVLSSHFLAFVLQSGRFEDFTNEWMTGSVNKFLNWSALEKFEFVLPPIAEQHRIVELLSAIDRVLNFEEDCLNKAIDAVTATSVEFLENPTVKREKLKMIASVERGASYKSSDYSEDGVGRPFLTLKAVTRDGRFSTTGVKWVRSDFAPENVASTGDLFFANTDLTPGRLLVGAPFFFTGVKGKESPCFSMDLSRVLVADGRISTEYLYFALNLPRIRKEMRRLTGGSTVGHLRLIGVGDIEVPILDADENSVFLSLVRKLIDFQTVCKSSIISTREFRKSLVAKILSGERSV